MNYQLSSVKIHSQHIIVPGNVTLNSNAFLYFYPLQIKIKNH
jgi:hypothetical protein